LPKYFWHRFCDGRIKQRHSSVGWRAGKEVAHPAHRHHHRSRQSDNANMLIVSVDNFHMFADFHGKVEGDRITLIKKDALDPKHPFLDKSQVASVEGNKVKLSQKVSAITTRAFLSKNS
jgi:hypothetical protein